MARLPLPALDLPISRTGLTVHYSPRFKAEPLPGTFRLEEDLGPFAAVLRGTAHAPPLPAAAPAALAHDRAADGLQALVDRFQNETGIRRVAGPLPVNVAFPEFGRSALPRLGTGRRTRRTVRGARVQAREVACAPSGWCDMTASTLLTCATIALSVAATASAQQPPRPADTPRASP